MAKYLVDAKISVDPRWHAVAEMWRDERRRTEHGSSTHHLGEHGFHKDHSTDHKGGL